MLIHPTADIHPSANIGEHVQIGAYSIIGENVQIGKNSIISPHVVIQGPTTIGESNQIYSFATIGSNAQDLKFKGEIAYLEIGDNNIIRGILFYQPRNGTRPIDDVHWFAQRLACLHTHRPRLRYQKPCYYVKQCCSGWSCPSR